MRMGAGKKNISRSALKITSTPTLTKTLLRKLLKISALIAVNFAVAQTVLAAPGALAEKPLILETNPVKPNIYFLVDDSGSMDWEDLLNAGTQFPASSVNGYSGLNFTSNNNLQKRLLCRGFNVMAYDPTATYKPWAGVDSNGNTYSNLTLTTARANPYNTSVTDITNHRYVIWTDGDNDTEYDGPGSTDINAAPSDSDECDIAQPVSVNTLSSAEQQNYANWYSYYRKREYVAKRALSQIIKDSSARIGLGSLHNHNNIRTPVRDIDDITTPTNITAQSNKAALLSNLYNINSSNGTPLRTGLENVGEYFSNNLSGSWGASPILSAAEGGQCQKNFAVVMSDGFWNGGAPNVGNTDQDGAGPWDGNSYADSNSNTLADVAMNYYETDLSDLANEVSKTPGIDENTAQHLVTYTVAFGVNGTLSSNPPNNADAFAWPAPIKNEATTIDDMRHAAWNGRGLFLSAANPQQLVSSLSKAIKDIDARSSSSAAVGFNTTSLQSGSLVYLASYNSTAWQGSLSAFGIAENGTLETLRWEAGEKLSNIASADLLSNRKLYTYNGTSITAFTVDNLTMNQKADLLVNKPVTETDLNYLTRKVKFFYGDHRDEIGGSGQQDFRNRNSQRLGDIIHSAPVYVGKPNTPYPDALEGTGNLYSSFANSQSSRTGTVYVGSNDGMLHAFNAETGVERFAYIPNLLYSTNSGNGLHALAETVYEHNYYVDLTPSVADVFIGSWKTMLVGGLRGGGKGIFALDITTEGTPTTQLEFTHADLGYTFSDIQIAKMNNGKWAAIFGNGYNNTGDGKAKLFIVYLDNSGYHVIDTGAGSIANNNCADVASDCNGLSSPALADMNGDGRIDRIYAGDLHGKMWAFNVTATTTSGWGLTYGADTPLFTACRSSTTPCPAADRQPITTKPALARHPTQRTIATYTNIMVMFGTGQYLANGDISDTSTQSFYGIWDRGDGDLTQSNIVQQTIATTTSQSGVPIRTVTDTAVNYSTLSSTDYGWYLNLPESKERMVVNPTSYGGVVFFNTMTPTTTQICEGAGGSGWLMALDIMNGGEPDFAPLDTNNDTYFNNTDGTATEIAVGSQIEGVPTESKFISDKRITVDSNKNINVQNIQGIAPTPASRLSWTTVY
ncbi:MAG: PQQ-binding-like beta-propeller repeat protein [Gammaproteobacteria bacterium]|nr:PQQ-binding-like beta-propeller repeat protein [Gammaproteobacteria bacterium]